MRSKICDSAEDLHLLHRGGKLAQPSAKPLRARLRKSSYAERRAGTCKIQGSRTCASTAAQEQGDPWDVTTNRLVSFATIPFLFLLVPQFVKNSINLIDGHPAALGVLSWMGYLTGLGGNTLLLSYFTAKRESGAVLVQAIGILSSFAVLTQIRAAGFMPGTIYSAIAAAVATTATLTGLKLRGHLDTPTGQFTWRTWQTVLGLIGLAVLPAVVFATLGSSSWLPSVVTFTCGCVLAWLEAHARLPAILQDIWGRLSAWTATLLFMMQPIAQLISNFSDPSSLHGLSLATILLAAAGNSLMVPRALWTRDPVWLTGSLWGALVFGWGQILSMWLGRMPESQQRFVSTELFALSTAALAAWLLFVLVRNARAQKTSP